MPPTEPTGPPAPTDPTAPRPGAPGVRENRLAGETSLYLRLHRHNPVDWYPWGEEALARARSEGKPIFLSVGYSTCYWCHVMERESFASPDVARLMNQHFVNVKVDREERPDLDEIYMTATQVLTGQGGWPNSVFLTPDLRPFYAGTYFPPTERYGRPGFGQLLRALAAAWRDRRDEVLQQAEELAEVIARTLQQDVEPGSAPPPADVAERSLQLLARRFDPTWGGFGTAPKFPTASNLFLLAELAGDHGGGDGEARRMLEVTLDRMQRGGIHDQLAGGFHRYSTDREWRVPHFEKMLYDQGLLLEAWARAHRLAPDPEHERVLRATAAFVAREMTGPDGALWSAIDAETGGHEGASYVWTRGELDEALGAEDAAFLAPLFGFDGAPFFEGDRYVLHLPQPWDEQAAARRTTRGALLAEVAPLRERLLAVRNRRPQPATDDKILTDWNGLAIAGLALAGEVLGDAAIVRQAERAATAVLAASDAAGAPLRHVFRGGAGAVDGSTARIPAFLSDYAFLGHGLLALHAATGDGRWLDRAARLADEASQRLADPRGGYFAAAESPDLLARSKELFDGALPAANAVMVLNLLELARSTGEERWRQRAGAALAAFEPIVSAQPEAARLLTVAARRWHAASGGA